MNSPNKDFSKVTGPPMRPHAQRILLDRMVRIVIATVSKDQEWKQLP